MMVTVVTMVVAVSRLCKGRGGNRQQHGEDNKLLHGVIVARPGRNICPTKVEILRQEPDPVITRTRGGIDLPCTPRRPKIKTG